MAGVADRGVDQVPSTGVSAADRFGNHPDNEAPVAVQRLGPGWLVEHRVLWPEYAPGTAGDRGDGFTGRSVWKRHKTLISRVAYRTGWRPSEYGESEPVDLRWIEAIAAFEADKGGTDHTDAAGLILWPDEDQEGIDYPGRWVHGEEGRMWLPTDPGSYMLIAGLPGTGKSRFAHEIGARENEAGGQAVVIAPEAAQSWRLRNRLVPEGLRLPIVQGHQPLELIRAALLAGWEEDRWRRGWPSLVIVDPVTELVPLWSGDRNGSPYFHANVVAATVELFKAINPPTGAEPPQVLYAVHTPETEQGGRGKRSVGGYAQRAGVAYLLPELGTVRLLKPPRDCPAEIGGPWRYTLNDEDRWQRVRYAGLGKAGTVRDRATDERRILERVEAGGTAGLTLRGVHEKLPGIGRVTAIRVLADLEQAGDITTVSRPHPLTRKPTTYYLHDPTTADVFTFPDEPPAP